MTLPINSRSLLLSLLVSTGGVVLAVFLQAPLLYRHGLTRRIPSRPPNIQRITFANGGTQTLLLAKSTINIHKIFAELVLLREANSPISPHKLRLNINPWISTCAEETSLGFIAAITGELYSLDLRQSDPQPHLIGKHQAASPAFLDCTTTASLLIVGDSATLSVWDTSTGTCLWQRNERATIAAAFLPNSERFFCCNCDEQMAELDARTGAMLKTWNSHCAAPFYLTFAKTAQRFAAISFGNDCVVSELGRKVPLWSLKLPTNFFTPKFSPDGQFLLAASNDQSRVVIYTAESGEPIDSLVGTKGEIVGLAVAPTGIVFAWNEVGAVTAWDLDTRTILHQFTPFGPI